jgi:hypothetical protein
MPMTPYALPYRVRLQRELAAGPHDLTIRVAMAAGVPVDAAAESLDATVLPFLLMATAGAFAGASIPPWRSTVDDWSDPIVGATSVEWQLSGACWDLQSPVVLAQMLLTAHETHPIAQVDCFDAHRPGEMIDVLAGQRGADPYPARWQGVDFVVAPHADLPKSFTIVTTFERVPSVAEQERIDEELSAWSPGLMLGAYGVAPVPPARCLAYPADELVFVDNELEWAFGGSMAHSSAIEGLINVFAAISQKVVRVVGLRVA